MPKIELRVATIEDVPEIFEMIRALAEYERLSHAVTATPEQLRDTLFAERPAAEVLLAYSQGECVGFALFFATYSTFLAKPGIYLEDLFVKPAARGKGAGAALLARIAKIAVAHHCGRVEWSVLNWNEPARRFYERLGATPMDEWTVCRLTGDALSALANRDENEP